MEDNYLKISSLRDNDILADVYELVIEDHLKYVDPALFKLSNVSHINPSEYYVTSGDAVEKTKALVREYANVVESLMSSGNNVRVADYIAELLIQQSQAEDLLNLLIKARGTNIFLETEWNQHHLLCIPKNPRAK
jgi:hypothetical protein